MERPTSVTVFGILNTILGVTRLAGIFITLPVLDPHSSAAGTPMARAIHDNPTYATWFKFALVISLVECAVFFASGIGLLKLKSWARNLAIGISFFGVVITS